MNKVVMPSLRGRFPAVEGGVRGFTLIELLVVIGLIVILAGLLLPALAGARSRGQAVACLNNHRQLAMACLLYVADFNDTFPYNLGASEIRQAAARNQFYNWTTPVMSWELDSDNTNSALLTRGGIGPYTGLSAPLYRCPADRALSDLQRQAGWRERVRSLSMNAMVGNAGQFSESGANSNNPHYRQFFRLTQVPRPATIFVFIEEHPDSINDGYFLNHFYSRRWTDLPAAWHQGAANLAFADGHVERRRWLATSTRPPHLPDAARLPFPIPEGQTEDFDWLMQRTSIKP
jgi:prepilin-type processing-associated H-X9-DG protein/prepilin-type N-terminal cleavage/methylation domain-containing protein